MRSIVARLVRVNYDSVGPALLVLCAAWLSGCAGSSSETGAWQASAPQHPQFSRILIVGISADFTQRCSFEFSLASQFTGSSTQPIVSCNTMTPKQPLTRANIESVAKAQNADAVLTSAVVSMQLGSHQGNTRDTRPTPYYQVTGTGYVTGALGAYGVPVAFVQLDTTASIPMITSDIHILTKLFDVKDATLVYTTDTVAKSDDMQSSSASIENITGLIGNRLRKDGVIH
jgi:hypothetical protein